MLKSFTLKACLISIMLAPYLAGLIQPELQAQELEAESSANPQVERFGIGLNGGLNLERPFLGIELSYRPASDEDRVRVFAQYDFLNFLSTPGFMHTALLGLRQDFYPDREQGNLRAYGQLMAGLAFGNQLIETGKGPQTLTSLIPAFEIGIGAEARLAGPLWGFAQISTGFPFPLRPELGMRLAF